MLSSHVRVVERRCRFRMSVRVERPSFKVGSAKQIPTLALPSTATMPLGDRHAAPRSPHTDVPARGDAAAKRARDAV
jgi:hypothetical protein